MKDEKQQIEMVSYEKLNFIKIFVNALFYRAPHRHEELELNLICRGNCLVAGKNLALDAKKGDVFVLNPFQDHELKSGGKERVQILSLQISREWLEFFHINGIHFEDVLVTPYLKNGTQQTFYATLLTLSREYLENKPHNQLRCLEKLSALLCTLLENLPGTEEKTKDSDLSEQARVQAMLAYVNENFKNKISLQELGERLCLSPQYISHLFTQTIGFSFRAYVAKLRFNCAIRMINETSLPLIDICYECGFSDYKYMADIFYRELGISPKEYRRHNKSEEKQPFQSTNEYIFSDAEARSAIQTLQRELL